MTINLSFNIERREVGGLQQAEVLCFNGVDYIRLSDVARFLPSSETDSSEVRRETMASKITVNNKDVPCIVVDGEPYLTMQNAALACGNTNSGFTTKVSDLEKYLRKTLAAKKQQQIEQTGHSDIDVERDARVRHKYGINRRNSYIKVSDIKKYFLGEKLF